MHEVQEKASDPFAPGRLRFGLSLQRPVSECLSSEEDEVSIARQESRADFPEVSLQLLDPSEWILTAYGGFFHVECIIILQARSILDAVRYAESKCPPGRLLVLSDNVALLLAICKGRSKHFTLLSVMRRIFASGFWAKLVLSCWWIPSGLNYSERGGRFFDCDLTRANHFIHISCATLTTFSSGTDKRPIMFSTLILCSCMVVKLTVNLMFFCPQRVSNHTHTVRWSVELHGTRW